MDFLDSYPEKCTGFFRVIYPLEKEQVKTNLDAQRDKGQLVDQIFHSDSGVESCCIRNHGEVMFKRSHINIPTKTADVTNPHEGHQVGVVGESIAVKFSGTRAPTDFW